MFRDVLLYFYSSRIHQYQLEVQYGETPLLEMKFSTGEEMHHTLWYAINPNANCNTVQESIKYSDSKLETGEISNGFVLHS